VVGHEYLFNGQTTYDPGAKTSSEVIVGAADAKYSDDVLVKTKIAIENLPGAVDIGGVSYPHPFYQRYVGGWQSGSKITARYKKKIGGNWKYVGSQSTIKNITFRDNPFAAQGSRAGIILLEEVGMFPNLIETYTALVSVQTEDKVKFGTTIFIGCVCKGTQVYNKYGEITPIENIKFVDGILGFDSAHIEANDLVNINPPQKKPCVRIDCINNNFIECSTDHPILVRESKKSIATFKLAKDIKLTDRLLLANEVPIFGTLENKDAYLLGYSVGDGYFYKHGGIEISVLEKELQDYFESNYQVTTKTYNEKTGFKSYYVKNIVNLVKSENLEGKSKLDKCFPRNIHMFNKETLSQFISGYFDADGNVGIKKNKYVQVTLTSISLFLLNQMKYLLLKYGIHCAIRKEFRKNGYKSNEPIYRLYISKYEDVFQFKKSFALKCNHKQDALDKVELFTPKKLWNRKTLTYVPSEIGNYECSNIYNTKSVSITKITDIGEQDVYNITTDNSHTYLANGFITHNTGGDMDSGTVDVQKIFYEPETYDCLSFDDEWEFRGRIGYFIPAYKGLNKFKDENGNTIKEPAIKQLEQDRAKLRNSKGSSALLEAEIVYRPLKPSEIFLSKDGAIMPIIELREVLAELENKKAWDTLEIPVQLYFDPKSPEYNGVNYKIDVDKVLMPINDFPWKGSSKEGAVVIYEFPQFVDGCIPEGAYLIGHDPQAIDDPSGDSLSAIHVIKTKKYGTKIGHDEIVATYFARPWQGRHVVNETLFKLSLFYGSAKIYFENVRGNTKEYFEKIKRLDLLAHAPQTVLTKKASFSSNPSLVYGYPMSSRGMKLEGINYLRDWLLEERGLDGDRVIRNLHKLRCKYTIKQLIAFNLDGNFDAIMSLMGCIIGLNETHNQYVSIITEPDKIEKEIESFLANNKKIFNNNGHKFGVSTAAAFV
jgi:hypothetical protein